MDKTNTAKRVADILMQKLAWWDCPWNDFDTAVADIKYSLDMQIDTLEIINQLCDIIEGSN